MRTTASSILAALALTVAGTPVGAKPAAITIVSTTVEVDDLDLSDPADLARLETRIGRAVQRLCGQRVYGEEAKQECRESARRSANEQLAGVLDEEQSRVLAALSEVRSRD